VSELPTVALPLPPGHWLNHEDHHDWQEQRYTAETHGAVGWPQFCRQPDTLITKLLPDAGQTTRLKTTSVGTGLKINSKNTELMKINTTVNTPISHSRWRAHQRGRVLCLVIVMLKNVWASSQEQHEDKALHLYFQC
jgi:hypothetical protein